MESKPKINLLIGCTGSVAATRIPQIIEEFLKVKHFNIKVIFTSAGKFFSKDVITDFDQYQKDHDVIFYESNDEWNQYSINKNSVLHIELSKWADVIVLTPLSANTLAKITHGICDNLLTCVVRAWDFTKKGFFCLAMNTMMYEHFATRNQTIILTDEMHFIQILSLAKKLKCGDIGIGCIADSITIVDMVMKECFKDSSKDLITNTIPSSITIAQPLIVPKSKI